MALKNRENIRDWWWTGRDSTISDLPAAVLAWQGSNPAAEKLNHTIGLHVAKWQNPRPAEPIARIEFQSSMQHGAPFLVGVTLE
jgi:hypothetical protein